MGNYASKHHNKINSKHRKLEGAYIRGELISVGD